MSLGGAPFLMSQVGEGLYRPFASDTFSELRGPGPNASGPQGEWLFTDASGRRFLFETIDALDDPALWLLTRITDSVGNRVDLTYDVTSYASDLAHKELNLVEVSHSHLAGTEDCPKYRIQLNYGPNQDDGTLVHASGPALGYQLDRGKVQVRRRLLQEIAVRANTGCEGFGDVLRRYQFAYAMDADSGRPRLDRVSLLGRGDVGPLPVAAYSYGSAQTGSGFEYKFARTVPLPTTNSAIGYMTATEDGTESTFKTTSAWVDFTGDGRPDFVRPSNYAPDPGMLTLFANGPSGNLIPISVGIGPFENLAEESRRDLVDWADGSARSVATESWQELIDWNGDGRMDIVQARRGEDKDHWLVMLSLPSNPAFPNGIPQWVPRQVNTYSLRVALKMRGHKGIDDDEPLPLGRSQTVGQYHEEKCVQISSIGDVSACVSPWCAVEPLDCSDQQPPYWNRPSQQVAEWGLHDINGDGFPDFVMNSEEIIETKTVRGNASDEFCTTAVEFLSPPPECWGNRWAVSRDWTYDTSSENRVLVYYNVNGGGLTNPGSSYEFSIPAVPVVAVEQGDCGLARWTADNRSEAAGVRTLDCGFREINGDGLIDRIVSPLAARLNTGAAFNLNSPVVALPATIRQLNNRERICDESSDDSSLYQIRTEGELVDVTGDGIPDMVSWHGRPPTPAWFVHVGTGVGFAPPRPLGSLTGKFEISVLQETCKDEHSYTVAGLVDYDGDGSADVVRTKSDASLEVQRLGAGNGVLAAGRLTAIRNGYGGVTVLSYANAKSDTKTFHQVPFPEIVVSKTTEIDEVNPTRSLDPIYFAYGDGHLQYNPVLARWTFPGYSRRVTVRGVSSASGRSVTGTAIVERYLQPDDLPLGPERYALIGRLKSQQIVVGTFVDAWSVDDVLLTPGWGWLKGAFDLQQLALNTNASGLPVGEECGNVDPISFQTSFPTLCTSASVISLKETRSWRGDLPPPAAESVETRSRVTGLDAFGRPVGIRNFNDTARLDDDVCVSIEYATPVGTGLLGVYDAVAAVHANDCRGRFTVSGYRVIYDDLPLGAVGRGLPTTVILERYNTRTGESLGELDLFEAGYDTYGNVARIYRERSDDVSRTTTFDYDLFGVAESKVTSRASDVTVANTIVLSRDPISLLPWFVEDSNGAIVSLQHDAFERITRVTLRDPMDGVEYMLGETVYQGDDPSDPDGRRITQRDFDEWIPALTYAASMKGVREATTYFDSLGRVGRTETFLGDDYGKTVVEGDRILDGLGRTKFVADAYVSGEEQQYGTSYHYNSDGTVRCVVQGVGYQILETPDAASDRYPTCYTYRYADHQRVVQMRGPSDLLSYGGQAGAFDESHASAIGWKLAHERHDGAGNRIGYATFDYDRLGQLTALSRVSPAVGGVATTWSFVNDSLGRVLATEEPNASVVKTEYDEWGSVVGTTWVDTTTTPATVRGTHYDYDGFARLRRAESTMNGEPDPEFSQYDYFYDLPSGAPVHQNATNLKGRLAWVSDRRGDGSQEVLTFVGYDPLGTENLNAVYDAAEGETYIQEPISSPMGNLLQITLRLPDSSSDELISYARDSAGRVKTIGWSDATLSTIVFDAEAIDPFGRYESLKLGNGVIAKYSHRADHRRELQTMSIEAPTFRREIHYGPYDGEGRAKAKRESCIGPALCSGDVEKTIYSYDAMNNLARAETVAGPVTLADETFGYDAQGNLASVTDGVMPSESRLHILSTDDPDRLCRVELPNLPSADCSFKYDPLGNVVTAPDSAGAERSFDYDPASRLVRASNNDASTSFRYDALGLVSHIDEIGPGDRTLHQRSYGRLIRKVSQDGIGFIERRIPGPLGIVSLRRGAGINAVVVYPHADANGNRYFSDADASEVQAVDYRPFGAVATNTGQADTIAYSRELWNFGDQIEAFELVQLGARFYDPRLGRFLQRDPVVALTTSNEANPYSFAFNDPVNLLDPSGLQPERVPTGGPDFEEGGFLDDLWDDVWGAVSSGGSGSGVSYDRHSPDPLEGMWPEFGEPGFGYHAEQFAADAVGLVVTGIGCILGCNELNGADRKSAWEETKDTLFGAALGGAAKAAGRYAPKLLKRVFGGRGGTKVRERLLWGRWVDYEKVVVEGVEYAVIGGRRYTYHAVGRLQPTALGRPALAAAEGTGRNLSPNLVEEIISQGNYSTETVGGVLRRVYTSGNFSVVTENADSVVVTILRHGIE